ncbi:hypothetical protein [Paucibacter soli]|uniref:hypothetical protein n=1 Tax=Paucibacter soli TaxID=3133433 RepID=UPI00309923A9
MHLNNKLVFIGGFEEVAECCMHALRHKAVQGFSSDGIKELEVARSPEQPRLFILEASVNRLVDGAQAFVQQLSTSRFGVVVGMSIIGAGFDDLQSDQVIWSAGGYVNGTMTAGAYTGSSPSTLPGDLASRVDNSKGLGALPADLAPELHRYATQKFVEHALEVASTPSSKGGLGIAAGGYPRWSLLTHAAFDRGVEGLILALEEMGGSPSEQLEADLKSSRRAGIASWVDTCLLGSPVPANAADAATRSPYSFLDLPDIRTRPAKLLAYLGDSPQGAAVGDAILDALSKRDAGFQDGSNPLVWLCQTEHVGRLAKAGLDRLVARVAEDTSVPTDEQMLAAIKGIAAGGFKAASMQLALNTCPRAVDGTRMVRHEVNCLDIPLRDGLGPLSADRGTITVKLLDAWVGTGGKLSDMPEEVANVFLLSKPEVCQTFEARRTEEQMGAAISGWTSTHKAPANDVKVVVKRRRLAV